MVKKLLIRFPITKTFLSCLYFAFTADDKRPATKIGFEK